MRGDRTEAGLCVIRPPHIHINDPHVCAYMWVRAQIRIARGATNRSARCATCIFLEAIVLRTRSRARYAICMKGRRREGDSRRGSRSRTQHGFLSDSNSESLPGPRILFRASRGRCRGKGRRGCGKMKR